MTTLRTMEIMIGIKKAQLEPLIGIMVATNIGKIDLHNHVLTSKIGIIKMIFTSLRKSRWTHLILMGG